jgi:hypothetical protein
MAMNKKCVLGSQNIPIGIDLFDAIQSRRPTNLAEQIPPNGPRRSQTRPGFIQLERRHNVGGRQEQQYMLAEIVWETVEHVELQSK